MTDDSPQATAASADGLPWHGLVALPAVELPVAGLAMASSNALGPTHAATAALGVGLLYATPVVGYLSLVGLAVDGRRHGGARWRRYAAAALAVAAVVAYHGTEEGALWGLWEPGVALALAMVPVGPIYLRRRNR